MAEILLTKPFYQNIKIDNTFFETHHDKETADDEIIESMPETQKDDAHDMLLSKQHTMFWEDDMYLDLAPGMNEKPASLLWDENAEELSFPSIYLGETRECKGAVTLYMMASCEIRRRDRRGFKPEHVLYMAMKIMRLRLHEGLHLTFPNQGDTAKLTRNDVEDKTFIEKCVENNFAFMKSIPNSPQYWLQKKKDVFTMMRQLGKPTFFLTLSATEYRWSQLLRILYRLRYGKDYEGRDPAVEMSSDMRTDLVNEDPTCCLYFNKLVDTIMFLFKSSRLSPFYQYRIVISSNAWNSNRQTVRTSIA